MKCQHYLINELRDKGIKILDSEPTDYSQIEFYVELWTSKKTEFAIVNDEGKSVIYSKTYKASYLLKAPFYNQVVENMIDAGVEILDKYPSDRLA